MQYEISGSVLAGQITTTTWAEAAVARATVPPRRSTLRWTCPGRALGEGSGRSGLGAPWIRAAQLATSAWAVAPSRTWAPTWLEPRICLDVAS